MPRKPKRQVRLAETTKNPRKYFAVLVETTKGNKLRFYTGAIPSAACDKATKSSDAIKWLRFEEITEAQYHEGLKQSDQTNAPRLLPFIRGANSPHTPKRRR